MSDVTTLSFRSSVNASSSLRGSVRRTPFYFDSQGQGCFAWLHVPEHARSSGHGVIICPPIGHEQVHAHRSLRHLAHALAEAKFPVLHFDYHGTGDSGGSDQDPERFLSGWRISVTRGRG